MSSANSNVFYMRRKRCGNGPKLQHLKKKIMDSLPRFEKKKNRSLSYKEVKKITENPVEHLLLPSITLERPLLCMLDLTILENDIKHGFIASYNPCV